MRMGPCRGPRRREQQRLAAAAPGAKHQAELTVRLPGPRSIRRCRPELLALVNCSHYPSLHETAPQQSAFLSLLGHGCLIQGLRGQERILRLLAKAHQRAVLVRPPSHVAPELRPVGRAPPTHTGLTAMRVSLTQTQWHVPNANVGRQGIKLPESEQLPSREGQRHARVGDRCPVNLLSAGQHRTIHTRQGEFHLLTRLGPLSRCWRRAIIRVRVPARRPHVRRGGKNKLPVPQQSVFRAVYR
mmetsp:Transcript_32754/g.84964  ORF Transcript_32754/g.84964 Transcript_32754/m.84964 type:complete len:243 (+) Transcript_32754:937-1665(+)